MKKLIFVVAAAAAMTLAGCNNAEYQVKDNILYFDAAADGAKSAMVTLDGSEVDLPMLVRLAQKAEADVEVRMAFDPALIDEFNKANGTDYVAVPAEALPAAEDAKVVIPEGEVGATYNLHVSSFVSEGATYAVPVQIAASSAEEIPISTIQSKFLYILTIPLNVSVPTLQPQGDAGQGNVITALPEGDWGIEVEEWTLETWVKMSGFNINNQAIFTTGNSTKGCEIYVRFGDANSPYNYLQAKIMNNNDISTDRDWKPNTWYHLAIVCTKADSKVSIYRDGVKIKEGGVTYPGDGKVKFDGFQMISSGSQYFWDQCSMGQVKLWKVARTQQEIKDNMYLAANPNNPNLIGYWPMDEGQGSSFRDATGNGHDASCPENMVLDWTNDVDFKN